MNRMVESVGEHRSGENGKPFVETTLGSSDPQKNVSVADACPVSNISSGSAAVAISSALKRHGVDVMFGQSLPSALHLAAPALGVRQVWYRQENAGGCMADGYARISHKVGVVTAQNGPAATLLVAPLAEALKASVPIVAICQEVDRPNADRNAFQELDHFALFAGVSKWIRRVDDPNRAEEYVDAAFRAATTGRCGPAVLMCPADMLIDTVTSARTRVTALGSYPLDRVAPDPMRVEKAADMLARAERPIVIAGGGVHLSDATEALALFQETAHLPVATTNMGKGSVDERHPLSVGVLTNALGRGSPARHVAQLLRDADVVLLIGTRVNQNGTDSWKLYPGSATFIHLDIDGQEIGRNYESHRLAGDARLGIEALTGALARMDLGKRKSARAGVADSIAEGKAKALKEGEAYRISGSSAIRPERIMADLDTIITPETIVCADASYSSNWILTFLTARAAGQRFLTPRGLAGLGWGFPMALGAKVAAPERPVLAVVGDGGFAHCWSELETARRSGLNIPVIVLNNGILGFQKHSEDIKFGAHTGSIYFEPVDHAAIARACGCHGIRIERSDEFLPAVKAALNADRPTLIEVMTDPNAHPPITAFEKARV